MLQWVELNKGRCLVPEPSGKPQLEDLVGEEVILDVAAPMAYVGSLRAVGKQVLVLENADVHFCEDSESTMEVYLLETRKNAVRPNRAVVHVLRDKVVSVSRLEDVILY